MPWPVRKSPFSKKLTDRYLDVWPRKAFAMLSKSASQIFLLTPLVLLTSCGLSPTVTRPDLPNNLYNQSALSQAAADNCVQYAGLSSGNAEYFNDYTANIITRYNFDPARLNSLRQQASSEISSRMRSADDDWARNFRTNCQNLARSIAARRVQDLQDARIISGRAQAAAARESANAASALPMQLPTFVPPTVAHYSAPQITPITPPGGNQVRCIQAGIYVNCRY